MEIGFKFGDVHSSLFGLKITKFNRSILPEITTRFHQIGSGDGYIDNGISLGGRTISVSFFLMAKTPEERIKTLDKIGAWLIGDRDLKKLVFDDEPTFEYECRVTGSIDVEEIVNYGEGTIEFYCPKPYKEEVIKKYHYIRQDKGVPAFNVDYQGTYRAFPMIRLVTQKDVEFVNIIKTQDDVPFQVLRFNQPYGMDAVIDIDCEKGTISINGKVDGMPRLSLGSEFFHLDKGKSYFVTNDGVAAELTYYNRYI